MLRIVISTPEGWDDDKQEFVDPIELAILDMEHSLVSLSKWESKYHKPFLHTTNMTDDETLDYIKFMTLTENVDPLVYDYLSKENIDQIKDYINDPATATTFSKTPKGQNNREIITAELIYCWMIMLNVPVELEKWHLNKLITLIRVCEMKNQPPKKQSKRETLNNYAALNEARKKKLNSKG